MLRVALGVLVLANLACDGSSAGRLQPFSPVGTPAGYGDPAAPAPATIPLPATSAVVRPAAAVDAPPSATVPAAVGPRAVAVLDALRTKDMRALSTLVHPDRGVRFSPFSYVDASDVLLTRAQILVAMRGPRVRRWGTYDGTGGPIVMTFAQYHARFIWDVDFTKAGARPADFGENAIDNAKDFYAPDGVVVEYYFDGGDPRFGGMDWRALRLVMAPQDGDYYLVGVVHAEWTI
jgi:hypothetical protein